MNRTIRIAMWSGPRNISTAMMRSFGNRADTFVCDEPFYAHYLKSTRIEHPGADEVMAHHETDWRKVIEFVLGDTPTGASIFYQKHMSHHLLAEIDRGWIDRVTNCFLIRDPSEVLTSLIKHYPNPTLRDTGLPQQVEIFDQVKRKTGKTPPVIDAMDVLQEPRRMLGLLCDAVGVEFHDTMLSWPAGRRATDGIWAKHWYDAVERSTGFQPYKPKQEPLPDELRALAAQCQELYSYLHGFRLKQ
ncbi:MAG: HAD family hydrolase [Planctomycetota bacterium]